MRCGRRPRLLADGGLNFAFMGISFILLRPLGKTSTTSMAAVGPNVVGETSRRLSGDVPLPITHGDSFLVFTFGSLDRGRRSRNHLSRLGSCLPSLL